MAEPITIPGEPAGHQDAGREVRVESADQLRPVDHEALGQHEHRPKVVPP